MRNRRGPIPAGPGRLSPAAASRPPAAPAPQTLRSGESRGLDRVGVRLLERLQFHAGGIDRDKPRIIAQRHLEAPRVIDLRDVAAAAAPGRGTPKIAVVARHSLQSLKAHRDPGGNPTQTTLVLG